MTDDLDTTLNQPLDPDDTGPLPTIELAEAHTQAADSGPIPVVEPVVMEGELPPEPQNAPGRETIPVQLRQDVLQLLRDRQSNVSRVLQQGESLIAQVEANHCAAQCAARAYDMHIHDVGDADEYQDGNLLEDTPEANGAGELLVQNRAHDAGQIVKRHEDNQGNHQSVHTSQKVTEPAADG